MSISHPYYPAHSHTYVEKFCFLVTSGRTGNAREDFHGKGEEPGKLLLKDGEKWAYKPDSVVACGD